MIVTLFFMHTAGSSSTPPPAVAKIPGRVTLSIGGKWNRA